MRHTNKTSRRKTPSVRIISGKWRRRVLPISDAPGLRPTGDRIRETLFNWLMPYVHGARCLDLFAGTGALGLEALSRGAGFVQFAENNTATSLQLKTNLTSLDCPENNYGIYNGDGIAWLNHTPHLPFDIVFLDPPFADQLWLPCYSGLIENNALAREALIYVERPIETKIETPPLWQSFKTMHAGAIEATLFSMHTDI